MEKKVVIPTTIEEYNRQEELKAKEKQERTLEIIKDATLTIMQLLSDEKVHKNMQANITGIKLNKENIDVDKLVEDLKKQIDKGFLYVEERPPVPRYTEKEQEHLNNPFYKKVDEITEKVALQQILKGAEKYPEPFNPASWTGEQLVNHGLQEARDLQVYLVGLAEHIARIEAEKKALEVKLKRMTESRDTWLNEYDELAREYGDFKRKNK